VPVSRIGQGMTVLFIQALVTPVATTQVDVPAREPLTASAVSPMLAETPTENASATPTGPPTIAQNTLESATRNATAVTALMTPIATCVCQTPSSMTMVIVSVTRAGLDQIVGRLPGSAMQNV
jgi:hypothetical protein